MKIHLREGIYSIILLLANVAVLLLFVYFATKNEIPMDAISITTNLRIYYHHELGDRMAYLRTFYVRLPEPCPETVDI